MKKIFHFFILLIVILLIIYTASKNIKIASITSVGLIIFLLIFNGYVENMDTNLCKNELTIEELASEVIKRKNQIGRKLTLDELKTICINIINENDNVAEKCNQITYNDN